MLTNKYSEGYPGKRYYGGNAVIDDVESLAIERAKELFGADHANVQPHSGANANMCAYQALLEPGDTVLGLSLDHGGHLTHGSPVNASGKLYNFVPYKVTPGDERIDMDQVRDLALEHRPKMIVAGTTSYPRRLDPEPFRAIADEVGALLPVRRRAHRRTDRRRRAPEPRAVRRHRHVHDAQDAARPARRLHPGTARARRGDRQGGVPRLAGRPARARHRRQGRRLLRGDAAELHRVRQADRAERQRAGRVVGEAKGSGSVSGGTDNHLMVVDLRPFDADLTGKDAQAVLDEAGITLEQEHHPRRSAQPVRDQRPADRHAVGDHAGDEGAGDGDHRRADRRVLRERTDAADHRRRSAPRSPRSAPSSPPTADR